VPGRVVLGVGNLIMSDEGLGVRLIQELERTGGLPDDVVTIDGGTSTNELLAELEHLELLIIVDAIVSDSAPGTLVRLEGDRIPSAFSNKLSPHQHGINDLLATLQFLDRAPARVVLFGCVPARIELGMELSAEVTAVMPELVARVIAELA